MKNFEGRYGKTILASRNCCMNNNTITLCLGINNKLELVFFILLNDIEGHCDDVSKMNKWFIDIGFKKEFALNASFLFLDDCSYSFAEKWFFEIQYLKKQVIQKLK